MFGGLASVELSEHSLPGKFWASTNLILHRGLVPNILLTSCYMVISCKSHLVVGQNNEYKVS